MDVPLYKKAEFPPFVLAKKMRLDRTEYIKQVRMPMIRMLQLITPVAEAEELFKPAFRAAPAGKVSSASTISHYFARSTDTHCVNCRARLPAKSVSAEKGHGGASVPLCESCKGP
ncbi:hypothetical protein VYU27_004252 [Nannochloropsis oceanica]